MRDFRLYMLVGGMPQAVNEYLDTNNLSRVDKVKRGIIDLYIEDFGKIDPSGRAARLFSAIPSELSKNASRYQVSSVLSDKLSANLGYVYENIVAQVLTATGNKLFYHTWPTESGKHNYEVDFLLSRGAKPAIEREERELAHYPEREQARPEVKPIQTRTVFDMPLEEDFPDMDKELYTPEDAYELTMKDIILIYRGVAVLNLQNYHSHV